MELVGRCHICGSPAVGSCGLCGRMICRNHNRNGVCTTCRRGAFSEESDEEKKLYNDRDDLYS